MNISAIKSLTGKGQLCEIVRDPYGNQWFYNTFAWYLVEDISVESEEAVYSLFNLTPKQIEKAAVTFDACIDRRLCPGPLDGDETLEELGAIWWRGELYIVLRSARGLLSIPASLTKPVRDDFRVYYARWPDDNSSQPVIALFSDLTACKAVIKPAGAADAEAIRESAGRMACPFWAPDADATEAATP